MNKIYSEFIRADTNIKDKDKALDNFIRYWLDRTFSMFKYEGLPDSIPQNILEMYLQTKGYCFITKENGKLYVFDGSLGGELNEYREPTMIIVSNPALRLNKNYNIKDDGVFCKNDSMLNGVLPLLEKYGCLLTEIDISLRSATINTRMHTIISSPDDKTKASADLYMKHIEDGDLATIGETAFFDGVKVNNSSVNTNYITQLIELTQYLKASLYNELGLNANFNMKREYIGKEESALNDDILLPLCDDMLKHRKEFTKKINEMYGTDITVDYDSSWKVNDSEQKKQIELNDIAETETAPEQEEKKEDDKDDESI